MGGGGGKSFVIPLRPHKILERESEIKLKLPLLSDIFSSPFSLFLTAYKSSKLSDTIENKRHSATSNSLQICLPKSGEPQIDFYTDDISSRSPQLMLREDFQIASPTNLMLTTTVRNKCI